MNLRKPQTPIVSSPASSPPRPKPQEKRLAPRGAMGSKIFGALIAVTYLWVLLTPFVPAVSLAGMRRFNLLTETFPAWAAQQVVPSMYNFANTGILIPESLEEHAVPVATNHFPTRHYTFNLRSTYNLALPQVLVTSSTYQGRMVNARHVIRKAPEGGSEMVIEPKP